MCRDVSNSSVIMNMEGNSPGASFSCMRRRIITSRNRAPPMTMYLEQQRKLQKQREGQYDMKNLKHASNEMAQFNATSTAPDDLTHFNYKFIEIEDSIQPSQSAVTENHSSSLGISVNYNTLFVYLL